MNTPKEMFDAMTNLYEGMNIDMNMTLRTQLKDVKSEIIQCYFTRRSQLEEKLEAIGDNVKEAEAYITNLNGLPSSVKGVVLEGRSHMEECT